MANHWFGRFPWENLHPLHPGTTGSGEHVRRVIRCVSDVPGSA